MTFSYQKWGRQLTALPRESVKDESICAGTHGATHVITEVKYGFGAQMTFNARKKASESKQEIQGSLAIAIKNMGPISASGQGEFDFADNENKIENRLKFTFHGDTVIDPPPQTYQEAVEVYRSLPARSLEDERVVSFSIAPLTEFCDSVGKYFYYPYLRDVGNSLITKQCFVIFISSQIYISY